MQPGSDPRLRLILADLEHAPGRLDLRSYAPSGYERARQGRISEVDREGVIQLAARSRGRHGPSVSAAILVEPGSDLRVTLAETRWRNSNSDPHREAP